MGGRDIYIYIYIYIYIRGGEAGGEGGRCHLGVGLSRVEQGGAGLGRVGQGVAGREGDAEIRQKAEETPLFKTKGEGDATFF